ncbi:hypothetical protein MHU86_25165 [Fragilaria crotonensis]|nr:hypothetical protein MHU86_25165 [Fragilaria crotonensis]
MSRLESSATMIEVTADRRVLQASGEVVVEDRTLAEEAKCKQSSSLETTFVSDTQGYGVMFTVTGKQEMLLVDTLEISAVILADKRGVHVIVYTKEGSYEDFQGNPGDWVQVADTVIVPAQDGRGTLIPPRDFHPVQLAPHSQRAFYVTLDTTDLRYSNSPGRPVGSVYVEDNFLQIHVGAGLLEYPFSNKLFAPRVFCGVVHYRRMVDCNEVGVVDTKVSYHFVVQHDSLSDAAIQSTFNPIVGGTITGLLGSERELVAFKESAGLKLDSVDTKITSSPFNAEAYAECTTNTVRTCSAVVSNMHFTHTDKLDPGDLTYHILQQRAKVSSSLDTGHSMDVVYVGIIPITSDTVVRLEGLPPGQNMNANQVSFEKATQRFLEDKLRLSSLNLLNVRVGDQEMHDPRRLIERSQMQASQATSSVDVFTMIMGSVKPPSLIDFDILTEEAIQANAVAYIHELKSRCDLTLESMDCNFFADITRVGGDCFLPSSPKTSKETLRERRQAYATKTLSEDTDLFEAQNDDDTFDDFMDENEAELLNRPARGRNWSGVGTKTEHATPLAASASWSGQALGIRSMGAAHSGNTLSQRSLMSQYSTPALEVASTTTQNKGTLIARGFSPDINHFPGYSASQGSLTGQSSATGLKSTYKPSQGGFAKRGSSADVDKLLDHSSSQRSLSVHDSYANLNQPTDLASRGSMNQSSGYTSSQHSFISQHTWESRIIPSSEQVDVSEMRHPGKLALVRDDTSFGTVRGDASSSNIPEYMSGFANVSAGHSIPSQGSHVGDSDSMIDVSLFMRSAATVDSNLTHSGHSAKRQNRVSFADSLLF